MTISLFPQSYNSPSDSNTLLLFFWNTPWASGWKNIKTMKWGEWKALCLSRYYLYNILVLPSHVYAMLHSVYLPWSEDPCKPKDGAPYRAAQSGRRTLQLLHYCPVWSEWLEPYEKKTTFRHRIRRVKKVSPPFSAQVVQNKEYF